MAMAEEDDSAVGLVKASHHAVGPGPTASTDSPRDSRRGTGTTRAACADLGRGQTFVAP